MKRETKYTLLSLPLIYLLLVFISSILSVQHGWDCSMASAFSQQRYCGGIGDFIKTVFLNGLAFSVYYFPVYIVIPSITFLITRLFRKIHEAGLITQSNTVHQKSKEVVGWAIAIAIPIILLYLWSAATGGSIFRFFSNFLPESSREKQQQTVILKCYDKYPEIGNLAVEEILKLQTLRAQCIKSGGY